MHAVIWNITPEEKQIQHLADQAEVIRQVLGETTINNIWKNVIIIAKGYCNERDFQVHNNESNGLYRSYYNFAFGRKSKK